MTTAEKGPLSGLRIIAVERYGAGPYGTAHLADLGADVIRIEHVSGGLDSSRTTGPYFLGEHDSQFYQVFNGNKRSLSLNLKTDAGREVFERLVVTADGLLDNMRGDQQEKLRLTHDHLKALNEKIVCAHITAYGREGERQNWPGYDYLMQAEAGFLSLTGEPDSPPTRFGLSMVDYMTGMTTAFALLAGIMSARETGEGRDMDVSLYDVAMHQLTYPAVWYLNEGHVTERIPRSGHPYYVPSQLCRTADGWISLMCQTQKFWEILCREMARPDLNEDPRFDSEANRHEHRAELSDILDEILGTKTTADWLEKLSGQVPCGPVYDVPQALDNPYFVNRGGIRTVPHPDKPDLKVLASPIRTSGPVQNRPAPKLGADNDDILTELGYDASAIRKLKDDNVI